MIITKSLSPSSRFVCLKYSSRSSHSNCTNRCISTTNSTRSLRQYSSNSSPPRDIAIIGGGISGLTTAWYTLHLFRRRYKGGIPPPNITIYESTSQLGGWIQTEKVIPNLPNAEPVYFEQGPRTIRASKYAPGSALLVFLIKMLKLDHQLRWVSKQDPSAKERYLYTGESSLYKLPSSLWQMIQDERMQPTIRYALRNLFIRHSGPYSEKEQWDESLSDFISRYLGPDMVESYVSAMIHGIWAGDVHSLSAEGFLRSLRKHDSYWESYTQYNTSLVEHIFYHWISKDQPYDVLFNILSSGRQRPGAHVISSLAEPLDNGPPLLENLKDSSMFYMKEGLGEIIQKLVTDLESQGVTIIKESHPKLWERDVGGKVTIINDSDKKSFDNVVCTIPPKQLPKFCELPNQIISGIKNSSTVSVGTVSFWIPDKDLVPYRGFGYLRPQNVDSPQSILGVLFDHNATPEHDTNQEKGTRMTVMLGGHYWNNADGDVIEAIDKSIAESSSVLLELAISAIKVQLGIDLSQIPHHANVKWNKHCIPQHGVGHSYLMTLLKKHLNLTYGKDKVIVAGTSTYGPGVPDCVEGSFNAAQTIVFPNFEEKLQSTVKSWDYRKPGQGRIV